MSDGGALAIDPSLRWLVAPPALQQPVLVVMLTGWIDAGGAARAAAEAIEDDISASPIAEFDDDVYLDFRARRPVMELHHGLNTVLTWERILVSAGHDRVGRSIVLITGPEPDMAWHRFTRTVGQLAKALGVTSMVHLGAYPFATPHTRPSRLSMTSASQDVLHRLPFLRSTLEVPAGAAAALEHELHELGIPTVGIWAQVPHYVAAMRYPAASVALLDGIRDSDGLVIDAAQLRSDVLIQRNRLDALIAGNDEHQSMVEQLERAYDVAADADGEGISPWLGGGPSLTLGSADELAAEVEAFLRDHDT